MVREAGGGTVVSQGTAQAAYTAPAVAGTFHVDATSGAQHAEASIDVKTSVTPVTIVPKDAVSTATGHGTQSHLAFAPASGWWLFHDPGTDPHSLVTLRSTDFATWMPGGSTSLPYPHTSDGRDLSVAYRSLNGHDVVHITQVYLNGGRGRYHVRGVLTAQGITFDTPADNSGNGPLAGVIPDGTATVILPNGTVIDGTGEETTPHTLPIGCGQGDLIVHTSPVMDDGTTSFSMVTFDELVLWCVGSFSEAHQLLALEDGVAIHLGADNDPPGNVFANVRNGSRTWLPVEPSGMDSGAVQPPYVFSTGTAFGDRNDWTGCVWQQGVRAVHRSLDGSFEHRKMTMDQDAGSTWDPGGGIPSNPATLPGAGLVLLPYHDSLLLLALSAGHVLYADIASLSPTWATLCDVPSQSFYLSGFAPASGAQPAVIWTQPDGFGADGGSNFAIAGALLP
jgi:hypothetical protein